EQDLARCGRLFEAFGDADDGATDGRGKRRAADEDLPGADAYPRIELAPERAKLLEEFGRSTERPQGVVLVRARNPEDCQDGATSEDLDCATVPFEYSLAGCRVPLKQLAERLGVGRSCESMRRD